MARNISTGLMLLSLALGFRGLYVWTDCGYDCPALSYPNLTATGAMVLAALAGTASLVVLLVSILGSSSKRR